MTLWTNLPEETAACEPCNAHLSTVKTAGDYLLIWISMIGSEVALVLRNEPGCLEMILLALEMTIRQSVEETLRLLKGFLSGEK